MRALQRIVAVAGLIAAGSLLGTTVGAQATEHCPEHQGHPGKVENVGTPSVDFEAGTTFCVKAGPYATGYITNWEGGTYTTPSEWHPLGKEPIDISYYVIYETPEPETPEPETPEPETPEPETPVTPEPETGQLPPPGTDEPVTVPPETEPVQLPPAPEVGADPPPAAEPELTDLPETGAALAAMAALGLALLAAGVGLRRFAR